jgi:hypothetical protein
VDQQIIHLKVEMKLQVVYAHGEMVKLNRTSIVQQKNKTVHNTVNVQILDIRIPDTLVNRRNIFQNRTGNRMVNIAIEPF